MTHFHRLATKLSAAVARAQFYSLIDRVAESGERIRINGPRDRAVLPSEKDWNANPSARA